VAGRTRGQFETAQPLLIFSLRVGSNIERAGNLERHSSTGLNCGLRPPRWLRFFAGIHTLRRQPNPCCCCTCKAAEAPAVPAATAPTPRTAITAGPTVWAPRAHRAHRAARVWALQAAPAVPAGRRPVPAGQAHPARPTGGNTKERPASAGLSFVRLCSSRQACSNSLSTKTFRAIRRRFPWVCRSCDV
jgi:hypothetical protein